MRSSGTIPKSLLSDAIESLIAAMYLDGGSEVAFRFVERHFFPEIEATVSGAHEENYKSLLQQHSQRIHGIPPSYHLISEKGPDHSKKFQVAAEVNRVKYEPAWGNNKKQAEQRAAQNALRSINKAKQNAANGSEEKKEDTAKP